MDDITLTEVILFLLYWGSIALALWGVCALIGLI